MITKYSQIPMIKRLALAGLALAATTVCANETRVLANGEVVEIFDTVGDFSWTAPFDANVELLVVGGGGGGGCGAGGGGGGGGQVYHTTAFPVTKGTVYAGSVGAGGAGGWNEGASAGRWQGVNGGDSVFAAITCLGGGGGGGHAGSAVKTGVAGGNSGGASSSGGTNTSPGATGKDEVANGWFGGHKGGGSKYGVYAGGGGGAMGEGCDGYVDEDGLNHSGNGANGFECAITGATVFYGCGGGGGCNGNVKSPYTLTIAGGDAGSGNASGGAGAKEHRVAGSAATDGTGSGGGGGGWNSSSPTVGGKGGSGIVVIRYTATEPIARLTAFDGFADGRAHSVAVEVLWPLSGTKVEHSTDGKSWGESPAEFASFGEHVGWVRVTAPDAGLKPCVLKYSVRIKDPSAENDGTFHFVAPKGESNPEAPYATWATAANDLSTALAAAAVAGDTVLVAPGTYSPDARLLVGANDVTIRSCRPADGMTDAANTILDGSRLEGVSLLASNAKLRPAVEGLTFRNCGGRAAKGGAINFSSAGAYRIRDCVFANNVAISSGGAIYSYQSNGGLISGCTFLGNAATNTLNDGSGGGAVFALQSTRSPSDCITLESCTFSNNFAAGDGPCGGAVQAKYCIRIFDCLFATNGLTINGHSGHGGSANVGQYSLVSNTTFAGWHCASYGIAMRMAELCRVVDCRFESLTGSGSYGFVHLGAQTVAERCRFIGCEKFDMFMTEATGVVVRNCLMSGCTGGNFLRLHGNSSLRSEHCTFAGNAGGCKIFNNSSRGTKSVVVNCIYVGAGGPVNSADHVFFVTNSAVSKATAGTADSGVIVTTDPGFRSTARQDYRLKADSVCVDAGLTLDWAEQGCDLAHDARLAGTAPDLGCFERQSGESDPFYGVKVVATEAEKSGEWEDAATDVAAAVAACLDGETVLFKSGTYRLAAPLAFANRSLLLRADVPGRVVLDAQDAGRCVDATLASGNLTLTFDGFVFRNGFSGLDYSDANHQARGGGLYLKCQDQTSRIVCRNCRVERCRTVYDWSKGESQNYACGGGAYVAGYCRFENCTIDSCVATNGMGGGVYTSSSVTTQDKGAGPVFVGCTIAGCQSVGQGGNRGPGAHSGGMHNVNHCWIERCTFAGNAAIATNSAGYAGGLCLGGGGAVVGSSFVGNTTARYGGAIYLSADNLVSNCTFSGNCGDFGSLFGGGATTKIRNCAFVNEGGTVYFTTGASPEFRNCLFAIPGCTALAPFQNAGVVRAENCTFAGCGTAVHLASKDQAASLVNCLFAGNKKDFETDKLTFAAPPFALTNCFLAAYPAAGCTAESCVIGANARFRDAAHGDYSLRRGSPCRDKAMLLDWMTSADAVDLAGNPRVVTEAKPLAENPAALPDIGCYENLDAARGLRLLVR